MTRGVRRIIAASLGVVLPLLMLGSLAHAAPKRIGGITISPAFQDVTIGANEASKTFDFSVTNHTGQPMEFSLSITDFGSLDESGGVLFMGKGQKTLDYRYGLTSWASLQKDRIVVEPNATETVPITITNKESLAPGGHYGAVLVTPVSTGQDKDKVDINQVMSSLLFVKKEGGEVYRLSLQDVDVQPHLFTSPSDLTLRFGNGGNVHVVQRGTVTITDPRGRVVKQGAINAGSAIVLPESYRQLTVPLTGVATAWMPGKYHMKVAYRFDGTDQLTTRELSFYYVNGWYVVVAAAILVLVVLTAVNRRARRLLVRVVKSSAKLAKKLRKSPA